MAVCSGRTTGIGFSPSRAGCCLGLAALLLLVGSQSQQQANAIGDTRTIILHHVHTNEDLTITYKRNGRYDDAAMQQISRFLRDWRRNEQINMDPYLIDLLWEVHREFRAKGPIHIICGYRAPETNAMLRARSNGVALYSQHMSGTATDFFIPGVAIDELRAAALRLQGGGVGYYPASSGSRFVHLDTGNVRHWPRMTREELVKVFPNQRTIHVPSDGQPLAGYALALAEHERGVKSSPQPKLALLAKASGVHDDEEVSTGSTRRPPMPMARPANLVAAVAKSAPQTSTKPAEFAMMSPASGMPAPKMKLATARSISPASIFLPWPTPSQVDRVSPEIALAYAAVNEPAPRMELGNVQRAGVAAKAAARRPAPATPEIGAVSMVTANPRAYSPWLRAVVLAPTMYQFMSTTQLNPFDSRPLATFMQKPKSALMMAFSADPYNGMTSTAFSGKAVQFLATMHFGTRTAALH